MHVLQMKKLLSSQSSYKSNQRTDSYSLILKFKKRVGCPVKIYPTLVYQIGLDISPFTRFSDPCLSGNFEILTYDFISS